MTWAQSLDANYTDGILMLHRGRIVYERYFGALAADRPHIAFSVTKSFVATVAATLDRTRACSTSMRPSRVSAGAAEQRHRRCHDSPAARHDDGPRLHRGLRDPKSAVWDLRGPADSRAAAGLHADPSRSSTTSSTLTKGVRARRGVRLQDGEHRRARAPCCGA